MDQEGILQLDMNVLMMILAMVSNVRIKYIYKNFKKSMCILLQSSNIVFQVDQFIQNRIHIKEEITIMLTGTKILTVSYKNVKLYTHTIIFIRIDLFLLKSSWIFEGS